MRVFFFLKLLMSLLEKLYMVFVNFESMYRSLHLHWGVHLELMSQEVIFIRGGLVVGMLHSGELSHGIVIILHYDIVARYVLNRFTITAF